MSREGFVLAAEASNWTAREAHLTLPAAWLPCGIGLWPGQLPSQLEKYVSGLFVIVGAAHTWKTGIAIPFQISKRC